MIQEIEFAPDSPLEGDGFEPSVPRKRGDFFGRPRSIPRNSPSATETGSFAPGSDSSNPSPSSGESRANLTSSRSERAAIRFRRGACQQALALWAPPKGSVVAQPGVSGACSRVPLQMMRSLATVQSGVVGRHRLPDPGPDPRSISAKERRLNKTPRRAARRGVFPLHLSVYSTTICPYIQGCGVQM